MTETNLTITSDPWLWEYFVVAGEFITSCLHLMKKLRWRLINIRWYVIFRWFHRFDRFSGYSFRPMNVLVFLMFNMSMSIKKSARWLMYVSERKDIAVCKHCFCYENFVTSKTKEYIFFQEPLHFFLAR